MGSDIELTIKLMIDFSAYVEICSNIILLKKEAKQNLGLYFPPLAYTPYLEKEVNVKMIWTYIAFLSFSLNSQKKVYLNTLIVNFLADCENKQS